MTITIHPATTSPARVSASGIIDLRAARDVVDVLERTAPEAVDIDATAATWITAGALRHLTAGIGQVRNAGRRVDVHGARPVLDLLLTIVGISELDPTADEHESEEMPAA